MPEETPPTLRRPPQRGPRFLVVLLVVMFILGLAAVVLNDKLGGTKTVDNQDFAKIVREEQARENVKSVRMHPNKIVVELNTRYDNYRFIRHNIGASDDPYRKEIRELLTVEGVPYQNIDPSPWGSVVQLLLPMLLIFALFYFIFIRQMRQSGADGGVLSFGKSRAKLATKKTGVTFDDVAGIDEAKAELTEIIEFLKDPKRFQRLGGRIPRGVLLVGPPGSGKTLLAKAIAGEADVPFYSISGSDFVEMFVGVGASRVRDLFRQAKESSPCLIFLDEIDAVGRRRGHGWGGGHDEREQTLNAILVEMDGFDTSDSVILLAATNRPDILDPALRRPGRFDREVTVDLPDIKGRQAILDVHARRVKLAEGVDLKILARGTPMFSGADLEAIINESAILAAMKNKEAVEIDDLEEARDKIAWGRQKRSRVMAEEDKRVSAYHEGGHALMTKLLPDAEALHKVTIIPRGRALGATMYLPERDRYNESRKRALAAITVLFGGRVAEELFCDDISSGAANDIKRATDIVRMMVREWGMSDKIGPINYSHSEEKMFGGEVMVAHEYSEATAIEIDDEIKRIIAECFDRARKLLQDNRDACERIAEALLLHEVLSADDVALLIEGKELPPRPAPPAPAAPDTPGPESQPVGEERPETLPGNARPQEA